MAGSNDPDVAAALARLAATRAQLHRVLVPPPAPAGRGFTGTSELPRRLQAAWRWLRRRVGETSIGLVLLDTAQVWWRDHPWRSTGELVAGELHASLAPLIRRHPLRAAALAAGAGVVLALWRPWRSPFVRRQMRPVPRHVGRWLLSQLRHPAVQSALAGLLLSLGTALRTPPSPAPAPAPSPAPQPPASQAPPPTAFD